MAESSPEANAFSPAALDPHGFNPDAKLPYRLKPDHVRRAMTDYLDFLGFIHQALSV